MANRWLMTSGRRLMRILAMVALVATAMIAAPSPAQAAGGKCYVDSPTLPFWRVCVNVHNGKVNGWARWEYGDGYFNPAYVWVVRCRVNMTGCGNVAETVGSGSNIVSTSTKDAAYGHVFRACTTFSVRLYGVQYDRWAVNYCSPWSSWP